MLNVEYEILGACLRMKNRLRKIHFGHLFSSFSLNSRAIRLKWTKNLPQNVFLSLRSLFSDTRYHSMSILIIFGLGRRRYELTG